VPANEVFELKDVPAIEIPVGTSKEVTVGATCADWVVIDPLAVEVLDVPIAFVALTVKV
jgi:hypothetical protein